MKKYFFKITTLLLFVAALTSCEDDKVIYDVDNGQSLVGFNTFSANVPAFDDTEPVYVYELEVGTTNKVNYDRKVVLAINTNLTTANPSQYSIDESTSVIRAGEYTSKIRIVGNFEALPAVEKKQLVFDLVSVQDSDVVNTQNSRFTIYLFRACPIVRDEFLGTYNADEAGDKYQVVATAGAAANEILLSNIANIDPSSVTHVFLGNDVANPQLTFPGNYPNTEINYLAPAVPGNEQYGKVYVNGANTSRFDSCLKTITLTYNLAVSAGTFTASTIVMTKQQ
jgi:hypothetical protein